MGKHSVLAKMMDRLPFADPERVYLLVKDHSEESDRAAIDLEDHLASLSPGLAFEVSVRALRGREPEEVVPPGACVHGWWPCGEDGEAARLAWAWD